MRIHFELTVEGRRLARPRRRRTSFALAAVAVALLLPAAALANHLFSDVPTTHTFHTNISNLASAGVTAGCGGGKYCPEDPVTRGQMAGFLNRGLGRVAEADVSGTVNGNMASDIGSVTITPGTSPGALPGAQQFVHAQFNGSVTFSNAVGCPCNLDVWLTAGANSLSSVPVTITVSAAYIAYPISAGGVTVATGSGPVTVTLRASGGPDPDSAYAFSGNLVAETVPFGHAGTSAP